MKSRSKIRPPLDPCKRKISFALPTDKVIVRGSVVLIVGSSCKERCFASAASQGLHHLQRRAALPREGRLGTASRCIAVSYQGREWVLAIFTNKIVHDPRVEQLQA